MIDKRHNTVVRCEESFFSAFHASVILRHRFPFLSKTSFQIDDSCETVMGYRVPTALRSAVILETWLPSSIETATSQICLPDHPARSHASSTKNMSESQRIIAGSMTFCSSRILPGQ